MEEKKEGLIETSKPLRMSSTPPPPPSVLKPFVDGGLAGLLSCGVNGAIDYSRSISNDARYRNHPNYVLKRKILGYYNIVRGIAVARNDGARPSLYQEASSGLIAGVATAYLRIPFDIICLHRQVKSMGPIAQWSIRKLSVLQILRAGGPLLKRNAGLGMGMVAAYNPSVHYLIETHGFSEQAAKCGAEAISAFSAAACAQLAHHASSFNSVRQTLNSKGPLAFFEGFSGLFSRTLPTVVLFWASLDVVRGNFQPPTEV